MTEIENGDKVVEIYLEKYELYIGAIVGIRRHISSINSKKMNAVGNPNFNWSIDIESSCAEMAVAKALGFYWDNSVGTYKEADIKPDIQVRQTEKEDGKLIVRPDDSDSDKYVLVTGKWGKFKIHGWLYGEEAKIERFIFKGYNGMPDAWFVPQQELRDLNEIEYKQTELFY